MEDTYKLNDVTAERRMPPQKNLTLWLNVCLCFADKMIILTPPIVSSKMAEVGLRTNYLQHIVQSVHMKDSSESEGLPQSATEAE